VVPGWPGKRGEKKRSIVLSVLSPGKKREADQKKGNWGRNEKEGGRGPDPLGTPKKGNLNLLNANSSGKGVFLDKMTTQTGNEEPSLVRSWEGGFFKKKNPLKPLCIKKHSTGEPHLGSKFSPHP